MSSLLRHWLAIVLLATLPLLWLWPSVIGGRQLVPFDPAAFPPVSLTLTPDQLAAARAGANYDITEVWPWLLPEMRVMQDEVAHGRLPTWNPHARTGAPLHEAGVHGVFYPPHWLWLFGGSLPGTLVYLTWISLALAGWFTFGLLREVGLTPLAAFFGAATFELSGTMATNGYFWTRLPALAWLPALLWALMRLSIGDRLRMAPLIAVALSVALPWLSGFPPYATAGTLIGGLLAVRLLLERLGRDGSLAARRLLLRFAFGFGLGVLLTMPQVLPSLWFFGSAAARSATPTLAMTAGAAFETYGLLGYLMPDAFGHPLTVAELPYQQSPLTYLWCNRYDADSKLFAPNYNYTEYSVFLGTLGLLLAGYGMVRGRTHLRWFTVVTLALLLGLALFWPGVRSLYHLPALANVAPMRWLAPATLLLAWLAAIGFDRLLLVERRSLWRLTIVAFALAVIAAIAAGRPAAWHAADPNWPAQTIADRFHVPLEGAIGHLQGGFAKDRFAIACDHFAAAGYEAALWLFLFGTLLGVFAMARDAKAKQWLLCTLTTLAIVQLGLHGAPLLQGHRLAHSTDTPVHDFLRQQATAAAQNGGFTMVRAATAAREDIPSQLPPGQLMEPGIRDLNFYTHFDARSIEPLRRMLGTEWSKNGAGRGYLERTLPDTALEHPLLDLLSVRYVLSIDPLEHAGNRVGPELRGPGGEFFVYERPHPLPRAFTVPELRVLPDDEAVLAALADPHAHFDRVAFVAAADFASEPRRSTAPGRREVRFVRDDPSVVELDIAAGTDPWLVLTDTYFAGWSATIDGNDSRIVRGNHAQRVMLLPAAACRVRFEHHSWLLVPGSGCALLALCAIAFAFRRNQRRLKRERAA